MSEVELPEGWVKCLLREYAYLKNGYAFKSNAYVRANFDTVPVIRISDIDGKKVSSTSAIHVHLSNAVPGFEVNKGDLLIAMSGATTGKIGIFYESILAYQNQRVGNIKLHSDKLGCKKYRNFLISSLSEDILKIAYGGAQPNISGSTIENIEIPLPPLAEQQEIAARLDTLLAQVDSIKARLNGVPALLKRFRQAVLAAAVSGRLTEGWRDENKESFNWLPIKLGEYLDDLRYGTSKKSNYEDVGGTPILRIPNIGNASIDDTDLKYSYLDENERKNLELREGDLLLIRSNGSVELVGKTAVVGKSHIGFAFAGYLIRLRVKKELLLSKFLNINLCSPKIRRFIENTARSTSGVNNINSDEIKSIEFELPSISEQTEIVARVETLFAFAEQLEARVKAAQAQVNGLTQSILAKAFRGELTAEWRKEHPELIRGENSAEALLKRIQAERENAPKAAKTRTKRPKGAKTVKPKEIQSITDVLKEVEHALSAQELLLQAGYSADADTETLENFYLDLRTQLEAQAITRTRKGEQDYFALAK